MTGIYPDDLPKTQNNQLIWHNQAPQISSHLKDLIDRMIALSPADRPDAAAILNQLNRVSDQSTAVWHNRFHKSRQREAVMIFSSSIAIAFCVILIRYLGWLQPMELTAFDRLMQLRPLESPDSRIVLITVDEADIQYQNQQNMSLRWSLADEALAQLLVKIKPYQPRTIGIDIYRDFAVDSDYPNLAQELEASDRLYAVCKVAAPQDGTVEGTPPPPEVPLDRLGFSDFVADSGDVIRRQLLHLTPPAASDCMAEYAFSLQLALDYLSQNGIEYHVTPEGYLQIGTSTFKPISQHSGGYQGIDAAGYQILLNYRSLKSFPDLAQQISLRDILSDRYASQLQDLLKDRLILIGVIASSSTDDWQTPYSHQTLAQKQIPGLYIQAQMISQILSTAIDYRPLIWWWSNFWSMIWIWGWALLGGILGWYLRRPLVLGSAIAFSQLILFVSCWSIFLQAGWIPLIPAALSLLLTALTTVFFKQRSSKH
jgi:CHASE2 domain-containing sensor protein